MALLDRGGSGLQTAGVIQRKLFVFLRDCRSKTKEMHDLQIQIDVRSVYQQYK
jgi:hypothetical protein